MSIITVVNDKLNRIRIKRAIRGKRRSKEPVLTIEEICNALKERGQFTGNYDDLVKNVRMFLGEMSRQLPDGLAVVIDVDEPSNRGYIEYFTDTGTGMVNERVTPSRTFIVTGNKIKVEGEAAECGVWFVSMVDPSLRFKVTKALAENTSDRVSGIVPVIPTGKYTVEIRTQFSESGVLLKEPKVLKGKFALRNYKILTVKDEEESSD